MRCVSHGSTTAVEIDSVLLERLRSHEPEKNDRELLESLARIALGRGVIRHTQEALGLEEADAVAIGVRTAREARRELAAKRRASS